MHNSMEWEPEGFSIKPAQGFLPSLLNSDDIDAAVAAKHDDSEIEKPGAEIISPVDVLSVRFPHIIARVQEFWGKETEIDGYFEKLVMMDRNSRVGFPKPIMDALLELWNTHRQNMSQFHTVEFSWGSEISLHKAFKKLDQEQAFVKRKGLTGAEAFLLDRALTDAANLQAAQDHLSKNAKPVVVSHDASEPTTRTSLSTLSRLLGD